MEASLTGDDAVITAYRAHGWTYVRGVPIVGVLAELTGKYKTGFSQKIANEFIKHFTSNVFVCFFMLL